MGNKNKNLFSKLFKRETQTVKNTEEPSQIEKLNTKIINSAVDAIFFKDKNRRYTILNKSAKQFLGKDAIGKRPEDIFDKENAKIIKEVDDRCFNGEEVNEKRTLTINNKQFLFHVIQNPIYSDKGEVEGITGIVRDITQEQRSEERYKALVENMTNAVAVYETPNQGKDFIFVEFNRAAETIENIPRDQVIGKSVRDVFPQVNGFGIMDAFNRVWKTGKKEHFPIKIYEDQRISGWRDNWIYKLPSGEIVAVYEDVTDQMKLEEELNTILSTMSSGLLVADLDTREFIRCNNAMAKMVGTSETELLKLKVEDIHPQNIRSEILDLFQSMKKEKTRRANDIPLLKRDGSIIWTDIFASKVVINSTPYLLGNFTDVTERHNIHKRLMNTKEELNLLLSTMTSGLLVADPETRKFIRCNRAMAEIAGYSEEELLELSINDIHPPEKLDEILTTFEKQATGKEPRANDIPILRKDGSIIWTDVCAERIIIDGKPYAMGNFTDVTERHRIDGELKTTLERLDQVTSSIEEIFWLHEFTPEGEKCLYISSSFEKVWGISREEIYKNPSIWINMIHPDDRAENDKKYALFMKGLAPFDVEYRIRKQNGEIRWVHDRAFFIAGENGKNNRAAGTVIDITDRKNMELALIESEKRFIDVAKSSQSWIWEVNAVGEYTYSSDVIEKTLGTKPSEVIGTHFYDYFLPEEREKLRERAFQVFATKEPFHAFINRNLHKNGKTVWLSTSGTPLLDKDGTLLGYRGVDIDITNLKLAEEALRESEQKYRTLVETASDGIFVIDAESQIIIDVNETGLKMLGLPRNEVIGLHLRDIHPSDEGLQFEEKMKEAVKQHKTLQSATYICKGDQCIPVQVNSTPMELKGRQTMVNIVRDITGFMNTEKQLKQDQDELQKAISERSEELSKLREELDNAKRLSDIGTLAASIAHELRNPLGVIKAAAFNIRRKDNERRFGTNLDNIDRKVFESDQIIRNLLSYARVQRTEFKELYIDEVIGECIEQIQINHDYKHIQFDFDLNDFRGLTIEADHTHLTELIFNLLNNAAQAYLDHKGTVQVIGKISTDKKQATLQVIDNGIGMSEEELAQIFEPFFTTRTKGIGLGMNVCQRVIDLLSGTIDVKTKKGKGTTVTVTLPLKQSAEAK